VEKMWNILDIKRSPYYAWLKRPQSRRKKEDSILAIEKRRIHRE
jgi:putative transposase